MEIKVGLNTMCIVDIETGSSFTVKSGRSAQEIAGYEEESEKEALVDVIEGAVCEKY